MWEEVMRLAMGNGIWAVLFCVVFFYQLKDNKKRENKYQEVIENLATSLNRSVDVKEIVKKTANKTQDTVKNEGSQTREVVADSLAKLAIKEGAMT